MSQNKVKPKEEKITCGTTFTVLFILEIYVRTITMLIFPQKGHF